jgi:hypothetical protein
LVLQSPHFAAVVTSVSHTSVAPAVQCFFPGKQALSGITHWPP